MDSFARFVREKKKKLQFIARCTRGEHSYEDVAQEAWALGMRLGEQRNILVDFADAGFQSLLLSHLFQHLVRYTDTLVRKAERLDHSQSPDGDAGTPHALMFKLVSDDGNDPLSLLVDTEDAVIQSRKADTGFSQAAAYLLLIERCDRRMRSLADRLLISPSHAYRCLAKARRQVEHQRAMPLDPASLALGPWRRYRAIRRPYQFTFEFDQELALAISPPDSAVG